MTRKHILIGALLLVLGAGVATRIGVQANPAEPDAPKPALEPIGIGALGRVQPASRVRKLNQAGGMNVTRLSGLFVREGDRVAAGQVLATFSDTDQKDAAVIQARAAVVQSKASLDRIRAAGRAEDIQAQREHVEALRDAEASLARDAARSDALAGSGAVAPATVERNHFAMLRAKSERAEAEAALAKLLKPRPEDVAVAEAELAGAEASLKKAEADTALSRVVAPIDGTILKIYARPGDQVGADGLLDMADLDHLDVVADVYETDLSRLREGAPAEVSVPGDPRRYAAVVRDIGWMVRRTTQASTDPVAASDARTVEVRLTLSEEGRQALMRRTDMQVQVAIRP
jgi:HlyD family secretion protein